MAGGPAFPWVWAILNPLWGAHRNIKNYWQNGSCVGAVFLSSWEWACEGVCVCEQVCDCV